MFHFDSECTLSTWSGAERDNGPITEFMSSISTFSLSLGRIMYGSERFAEAEPLHKILHSSFAPARFSFQRSASPWPTAVNSFHSGTNPTAAQRHRLLSLTVRVIECTWRRSNNGAPRRMGNLWGKVSALPPPPNPALTGEPIKAQAVFFFFLNEEPANSWALISGERRRGCGRVFEVVASVLLCRVACSSSGVRGPSCHGC